MRGGEQAFLKCNFSKEGFIGVVDPQLRVAALLLYHGLLKILPMDAEGRLTGAFNIRCSTFVVCFAYRVSSDWRR